MPTCCVHGGNSLVGLALLHDDAQKQKAANDSDQLPGESRCRASRRPRPYGEREGGERLAPSGLLFFAKCLEGVDARGAVGWRVASDQSHA